MQNKTLGILGSSVDPTQLSATVSGLIMSFSALIIWLAKTHGIIIGSNEIMNLASQVGGVVGEIVVVYGLCRKLVIFVHGLLSGNRG